MKGMMTAYIIWSVMAVVFVLFGIYARAAKKPVSFWTVQVAIEVRDVKKYNRAVSKLWFGFAVLFEAIGFPLALAGQQSAWAVVPIIGGMFWAIALAVVYTRIEKKYRIY